jgi:hypothetical protein
MRPMRISKVNGKELFSQEGVSMVKKNPLWNSKMAARGRKQKATLL